LNRSPKYVPFAILAIATPIFPFQTFKVVTEKKDSFSLHGRSVYPSPFHQKEEFYFSVPLFFMGFTDFTCSFFNTLSSNNTILFHPF
jgi:hypothetical protein